MSNSTFEDDWPAWKRTVLDGQQRIETKVDQITQDLVKVQIEVSALRVKVGIWSSIVALITSGAIGLTFHAIGS